MGSTNVGRFGLRRRVCLGLAAAILIGSAEAKIVQPPAEETLTVDPDAAPHIDYYMLGTIPTWWNQNPAMPYRWPNLGNVGTISIARGALHDAIALRRARFAEQHAIRFNRVRIWAVRGFSGIVTPLRTFENHSGLTCREFEHELTFSDGAGKRLFGTACHGFDGAWTLVAEKNLEDSVSRPTKN